MPLDRQRRVEHLSHSAELPIEEAGLLFVRVDSDFDGAAHSNVLLVLEVLLDNSEWRPAHCRDETAIVQSIARMR
jgi:hypothetical protein